MSCIGQSASLLPAAGLSAAVVASDGGRGCRTRQPRSRCRLQETRVGLQEGRGAFRASRPGGCLPAPALGVFQVARTHRLGARTRRGSASCRAAPGSAATWARKSWPGADGRSSC